MDKIRKILIVTDLNMKRFDTTIGFIFYFLKECFKRNIYVEYVVPVEPCALVKEKLMEANFNYTVFKNWWTKNDEDKKHNVKIAFGIWKRLKSEQFDLVEFNFCFEITAIIISALSRLTRQKTIFVWRHHSEIRPTKSIYLVRLMKKYLSKLKILSWFIDVISPVYKGQESILLERGIPTHKISTIYNGIDLERFDQPVNKKAFLSELGFNRNCQIVLTIANLVPRKGLEYFLSAASRVIKRRSQTVFLIVGDGFLNGNLKSLAANLGISNNVFFLGTRNDVHKVLSVCDVFVLSSISEAFPIVNIEAMAAKKPVVATNIAGIPEIVRHNINGILVPPKHSEALAEAMVRILTDKKLAKEMGLKGREIVEGKFTIEQILSDYFSLYENCLRKGS